MLKPLKITYLFDSTTLWGGTKVALEQAEILSRAGHKVTILSKDAGPTWYPLQLTVVKASRFDASTIPESDIIVGTYWPTVKEAYESGKGIVVHFCQGYEGDYNYLESFKSAIDEVYSYKIPKLTVSPHLNKFLIKRFNAETYYIGQMLNRDIFYPSTEKHNVSPSGSRKKIVNTFRAFMDKKHIDPFKTLVIGPFEVDFKNIPAALQGISFAKTKLKLPIKLIRVSQFPLSHEEEEIIKPDTYHFYVPHHNMGNIYREADLFVSMSTEAEGFGLPALEAMACGVPTILSRISSYLGFDETPDYALFVEQTEPESVAAAIKEIFHNSKLRDSLIRRGLDVSKKFTPENVLFRLQNAFTIILDKNARSDNI